MAKKSTIFKYRSIKLLIVILIIFINGVGVLFILNYLFGFYEISFPTILIKKTFSLHQLPTPTPTKAPLIPSFSNYSQHSHILATMFWIGEKATNDNDYIPNATSEWDDHWLEHYGGIDKPQSRNGYFPNSFTPKENPFYVALPYDDLDNTGRKPSSQKIPWYLPTDSVDQSILKNKWVKITYGDQTCYGQWEDVGPFETDDFDYVFGSSKAKQDAGIDLSPALRTCLNMTDNDYVNWQFINSQNVPRGPWSSIVTTSPTNYSTDNSGN